MNPIIRWAGSKRALLPALRRYWNDGFARYIEPFCGSSCLFFDLEPAEAILGDINPELILTYRALQRDASRVFECLCRLSITEATYYKQRAIDPFQLSECESAARFLFLNRLCFNGIFRTNRNGRFNVPYGPPKGKVRFEIDALLQASKLLKRVTLLQTDFETTLSNVQKNDFVYLDPPYALSKRRIFSEYHPDTFGVADLDRLTKILHSLDRRGAKFVLSYADSKEGRALVGDWNHTRIRTKRNVAGFAGDRRAAYEVMASNLELDL